MSARTRWAAVLTVALGTFVLVTNEFLPVGLLVPIAHDLGVSTALAGTMVTVPAIVAAVSAPTLTLAAGRLDRRLFLIGMTVLFTVADVVGALAPNFAIMLVARILLGVGIGGFWAIGGTVGGRLVGTANAGRATAIIFGGISVATVVGVPAAVALGVALGWRIAFAATAVLALIALVLLLLLLPALGVDKPVRMRALTAMLRSRGARSGLLTTILLVTGHFLAYTFISPFLLGPAGLSPAGLTLALFAFGAAGLAGNFLVPPLATRHLKSIVIVAAVLIGLAVLYLVVTDGTALPIVAVALWGLGYGAVPVALQLWIGRAAPAEFEVGSSLYIASFQGSIAIGSLLGAVTIATGTASTALAIGAALVGASVLAFAVTTRATRPRDTVTATTATLTPISNKED